MPIMRYFMFVGGTLLALLLICDAVLPNVPLPSIFNSGSDLPPVRIRSERKWPERIVMDTSIPSSVMVAKVETASPTAVDGAGRVREAFAQMTPAAAKAQPLAVTHSTQNTSEKMTRASKVADATAARVAEARHQAKRRIARAHPQRPMMLVAQQPHFGFGWFGSTW